MFAWLRRSSASQGFNRLSNKTGPLLIWMLFLGDRPPASEADWEKNALVGLLELGLTDENKNGEARRDEPSIDNLVRGREIEGPEDEGDMLHLPVKTVGQGNS